MRRSTALLIASSTHDTLYMTSSRPQMLHTHFHPIQLVFLVSVSCKVFSIFSSLIRFLEIPQSPSNPAVIAAILSFLTMNPHLTISFQCSSIYILELHLFQLTSFLAFFTYFQNIILFPPKFSTLFYPPKLGALSVSVRGCA